MTNSRFGFRNIFGTDFFSDYIHVKTDSAGVFAASESYIATIAKHDTGIHLYSLDQYAFNTKKPDEITFEKSLMSHSADTSKIRDLTFSPFGDGKILVSCHSERGIKVWDCDEKELLKWNKDVPATQAKFHPYVDSLLLVNHGTDATVGLYDAKSNKEMNSLQVFEDKLQEVSALNWFHDHQFVYAGNNSVGIKDIRGEEHSEDICIPLKGNWRIDHVAPVLNPENSDEPPNFVLFMGAMGGSQYFGIIDVTEQKVVGAPVETIRGSSKQFFHLDQQNSIFFVGTKGHAQIKYYDIFPTINGKSESPVFLNTYTGEKTFSALCVLPARVLDVKKVETTRFVKMLQNQTIELVSFYFPKKLHKYNGTPVYHEDIYAEAPASESSSLSAEAFFEGKTSTVNTKPMQPENTVSIYDIPLKEGGKLRPGEQMKEGDYVPTNKSKYTLQQEKEAAEKKRTVDPYARFRHESQTSSLSEGIQKAVALAIDSDDDDLHDEEEGELSDGEWDF